MAAVHGGRRIIQTPGWTETAKASRLGQLHMVGHRALISNLGVVWQIVEMLQTKLVLTGGARTQVPHDHLPCVEVLTDTQHKLRDVRVFGLLGSALR